MPVRVPANSSPGGMRVEPVGGPVALAAQQAPEDPADDVGDERARAPARPPGRSRSATECPIS